MNFFIIIDIVSFCFLVINFFTARNKFSSLPEQVPIHFNIQCEADGYGHKRWIFFPAILGLGVFILMMLAASSEYNYPVEITKENYEIQKTIGDILIKGLNGICMVLLYLIMRLMIDYQDAKKRRRLSVYLMSFVVLTLVFPIIMLVVSYVNK